MVRQGHRRGPDGLRWGVESICTADRAGCPDHPGDYYDRHMWGQPRELRDGELQKNISRVTPPTTVFGARKVWLT